MSVARPLLFAVLLASMLPIAAACGKKGPPLAPLRPAPALISDVAASRLGDTVAVQFTVPTGNADSTRPADLAYVDVYAATGKAEGPLGRPLTTREIETLLTRVGRVEVQPPPPPEDEEAEPAAPTGTTTAAAPAVADPRPVQGQVVRVEETLTDAVRGSVFEHPDAARIAKVRAAVGDEIDDIPVPSTEGTGRTLLWPQPTTQVARTYITIPYSTRGTAGPPSAPFAVPMTPAPPTPPAPTVTHDATSVTVTWATPPGVQLPLQRTVTAEQFKADLTAKKEEALLPARPLVTYGTPHTYRVYEVAAPGATDPLPPGPLNTSPLETGSFTDPRIAFGTPRCYAVRTVEQQGKITIESPLSAPACITAVGSGGGVSLIWEPVTAPDLAGYLVLRGVEGEALKPITEAPVTESTFRDTTAQPGVMYIYAVVAVDKASPANASPESNRVRESAR